MARSLIIWLIVGAIAGWLAGLIVKGYGFGLIGNIVVGIIGAVIAGWLLPRLGISLGGTIVRDDHRCHDRRRHLAGDHRAGQTLDRPAGDSTGADTGSGGWLPILAAHRLAACQPGVDHWP